MSINLGGRGAYLNVGVPGSGLSYRKRLTAKKGGKKSSGKTPYPQEVEYALDDKLELKLANAATGRSLGARQRKAFLADYAAEIDTFLDETALELSRAIEGVGDVHLSAPVLDPAAVDRALGLTESPTRPDAPSFPDPPFPPARDRRGLPAVSGPKLRLYRKRFGEWLGRWRMTMHMIEEQWVPYSDTQAARIRARGAAEARMAADPGYFAEVLTSRLDAIPWPRETVVECVIGENPKNVFLSVDLPEIEDLPTKSLERAPGAVKLLRVDLGSGHRRTMYNHCVLSIGAALMRIAFETAPHLLDISLDGYTQLSDGTGGTLDRIILQIRAERSDYEWDAKTLLGQADLTEMATRDWCHLNLPK